MTFDMTIEDKFTSLVAAANAVTGKQATDITEAIQNLKDGYGGGGGEHSNYYPHHIPYNLNMTMYEYEVITR